jgi:hypothetical protein
MNFAHGAALVTKQTCALHFKVSHELAADKIFSRHPAATAQNGCRLHFHLSIPSMSPHAMAL